MLDTMIKKKFTDIIDNLDAEINDDIAATRFRNSSNAFRILSALEDMNSDENATLASSEITPDTMPSSSRTHHEQENSLCLTNSEQHRLQRSSARCSISSQGTHAMERMEQEIYRLREELETVRA